MRTLTLVDGQSATGVGSAFELVPRSPATESVAQIVIADTATAAVQGSHDGTNWYDLLSSSSSTGQAVTLPRFVRGNVTAHTAGTVSVFIGLPYAWTANAA